MQDHLQYVDEQAFERASSKDRWIRHRCTDCRWILCNGPNWSWSQFLSALGGLLNCRQSLEKRRFEDRTSRNARYWFRELLPYRRQKRNECREPAVGVLVSASRLTAASRSWNGAGRFRESRLGFSSDSEFRNHRSFDAQRVFAVVRFWECRRKNSFVRHFPFVQPLPFDVQFLQLFCAVRVVLLPPFVCNRRQLRVFLSQHPLSSSPPLPHVLGSSSVVRKVLSVVRWALIWFGYLNSNSPPLSFSTQVPSKFSHPNIEIKI